MKNGRNCLTLSPKVNESQYPLSEKHATSPPPRKKMPENYLVWSPYFDYSVQLLAYYSKI